MSDLVERLRELDKAGRAELGKHAWSINDPELYADLCQGLREAASEVERLTRERDEAHGYASRFLTSFVAQHCNPVPGWAPLHDLIGVLTQIDNASTVAREYRSNLTTLTARTREVLAPFAEYMSNGADLDNKGNPLSDNAGVGWVYLKIGDFRAANTLFNELKEKDNG